MDPIYDIFARKTEHKKVLKKENLTQRNYELLNVLK